ncbi:hypothetical protein [Verrucomicrobium sp. BvORR106]|uniref:WD40 repeat domain-containing protein n=1 Tax=Verrucomicrobium sp. BvORR106 TaxID=1403819 RepID=UPI00057100E5|nr:hypothetical protein [Verrucomicrobium sp. BvORR106]
MKRAIPRCLATTFPPRLLSGLLIWTLLAGAVVSQSPPAGDDITTGTRPAALQFEPVTSRVPGMIRWMWDPKQTVPRIEEAMWLTDGSRMYARSDKQQHRVQIWEPVAVDPASPARLDLKGYLPLGDTWAASLDGQWIFGERRGLQGNTMALYRTGTWEGMWEARNNVVGNLEQAVFTRDGRHLILVTKHQKSVQVHAIDPASGRRVRHLDRALPAQGEGWKGSEFRVCVTRDAVLLPPFYRDDLTLSRWSPADGKHVPVSKPMSDNSKLKMTLSSNERWLVLWNSAGYRTMELEGGLYGRGFSGKAEDAYIQNVQVSPDATTLVVSGGCKHQVIRLTDQQLLTHSTTECLCGLFAADGRTFWNTCRPLTPISTRTWQRADKTQSPPQRAIEQVGFSPDGNYLASRYAKQIDLWRLDGQSLAPSAILTGPRDAELGPFAWDRNTNRIIGGDLCAFLQWEMPKALNAGSIRVPVQGTQLFETFATAEEQRRDGPAFASSQQLTVSPSTGDCLISLNHHHEYTEIRHPDRPTVGRSIKVGTPQEHPTHEAVFSTDGSELFYLGDEQPVYNQLLAYHLADEKLRISAAKLPAGSLVGFDPQQRQVVLFGPYRASGLMLVDAAKLELKLRYHPPDKCSWSKPAALSPDGRRFVCGFQDETGSQAAYPTQFIVADIDTGKILAVVRHADPLVEDCAFSPDGTKLAFAHGSGNVSLWSVDEMLKNCPAPSGLTLRRFEPGQSLEPPRASPKPQEPWKTGPLTEIRQPVSGGDTLQITADGAVFLPENRASIGQVLINGEPLQVKGHRYRQIAGTSGTSYLHVQTELRSAMPKVRHHRELQIPSTGGASVCDAIDNLGLTPVSFDLSIVAAMGGDLADLRDSSNRPPGGQGKYVNLPENAVLGTQIESGGVSRLTALALATADPEQKPVLTWDAARKAILCTWTVHLEPFERCHLRYGFLQRHAKLSDELLVTLPKMVLQPWSTGMDTFHIRKLNMEEKSVFMGSRRPTDGTRKDALGYGWRTHARTMDGMWCEVGASQLLGLWFDGEPSSYGMVLNYESGAPAATSPTGMEKVVECSSAAGPMRAARRVRFNPQTASLQTVDTLYSAAQEPVTAKTDLTVLTTGRISAVLDARGNKLDVTKPIAASQHGNRFAVVFENEREPAVLVALADPDGKLRPTLHLAAGNGLFIRYETTLKPNEKVPLVHAATQRRLADSLSIEEVFAAWDSAALLVP